ncbi:alpha/beta hydrolase [Idiomarina xiamenensis 10-D-4]|uniref:Alpha/beta hydrolase n=2 Tax=Idiomarina xiamenensis TaxID=1207041 RepID=K2KJR7_9GAMM|nr:alpha/beta hydrolase [Idiomarina xiamenensis 10-D-4]
MQLPGVHCYGDRQQAPLLLLHSSQSNSGQWRGLIEQIQTQRFVIAVDLYGYGQAPATPASDFFRFSVEVERLQAIIEALAITQPLTLVGHSYGGALALKLALQQPFAVDRLAVYEPVAFNVLAEDSPARAEIFSVSEQVETLDERGATRAFVDYWNDAGFFDALPSRIQTLMVQQNAKVSLDFQALINEPLGLADYAAIEQPTLLLQGRYSRRSAHAVAQALSTVLANLQQVTIAAGHMGPITHAEEVNTHLLAFLLASK